MLGVQSQISEIKTKFLVKLLAGLGFDLEKQHVLLIVDELTIELQRHALPSPFPSASLLCLPSLAHSPPAMECSRSGVCSAWCEFICIESIPYLPYI